METPRAVGSTDATRRIWTASGVLLLVFGLLCHVAAARAIGGSYVAYRDHIFGFVLITAVVGAIVFTLGSRFWRRRIDISLLILGLANALLGVLVYVQRFHVHG